MTIKEYALYMINEYEKEVLEPYISAKNQKMKRIKNKTKIEELINITKDIFQIPSLNVTLKTGPNYNGKTIPWIQITNKYNNKGTHGEYLGISFDKDNQTIEMWFGFGYTNPKLSIKEIRTKHQQYETKLKTIEPNLQRNFQYDNTLDSAIIIKNTHSLNTINDTQILDDLNYLAHIYNIYEEQYRLNNDKTTTNKPQEEKTTIEPSKHIQGINMIYKGFPGTGKSYTVKLNYLTKKDKNNKPIYDDANNPILINSNQYKIVTFHPEYTNANFIGSILPVTENNIIHYNFVPGPFTQLLKTAIDNPQSNFYLIIEEINRGNAAAIFGELFNLLDRENDGNGQSIYKIDNEFIANYVFNNPKTKIYLPKNLSIIATMNSSDQNVIPLDTAFERRWETTWITDSKTKHDELYIKGLNNLTWGHFRTIINNTINTSQTIIQTEDKKLGSYFINKSYLTDTPTNNPEDRLRFTNKVINFLYENVKYFNKTIIFNTNINCIDDIIKKANTNFFDIFNEEIKTLLGDNNESNPN